MMNQPTQHRSGKACDHRLIDQFLDSENYRIEDEQLIAHLNSCLTCRESLETGAGSAEVWKNATELLKPDKFDQAGTAPYSAATFSDDFPRRPVAARDILESLTPSENPHHLGRLRTYEVTGVIGIGGMGVVLKAIDPSLDRVVAVKVMAPRLANNEKARKRFAREAKAAAAVLHPNVIPIHSVSSDSEVPYLVMAYVRGGSLQKRLESEGPLQLVELLRIGSQIAAGLAAAHEQGLIHRDIKPENILLEEGVERVTITDFGLARAVDDNTVTQHGAIAGTPQYMSPEQARGEQLDQQSDLFSLGSVLYALCTGRPPYRGDTSYGVMRQIIDEEPTPVKERNPGIPQWLVGIIEKLMAKEKAERFASAAEVHKLMDACLSHVQQPEAIPLPDEVSSPDRASSEGKVPKLPRNPAGQTDIQPNDSRRKPQTTAFLPWWLLLLVTLGIGIFAYARFGDDGIVGVLGGLYALCYLIFGLPPNDSGQLSPAQRFVLKYRIILILGTLLCIAGAASDMSLSPQRKDLPQWFGARHTGEEQNAGSEIHGEITKKAEFPVLEVNVDLAERLVGRKEHLTFTKLKTLSPEVAAILARHPANLSFPALEQISPEVAKALANKKQLWLRLNGLQEISPEVALALASAKCALSLVRVRAITPELAEILVKPNETLSLGLSSITPEVASVLSQHNGWLSLNSLRTIDTESAAALAGHQHWITLDGLTSLTPDVAEAIGNFNGDKLDLSGLKSLDFETAKNLSQARCRSGLYLNGLTTLTPEILKALANGNSGLSFQGLEEIDSETKQALEATAEKLGKFRQFLLLRDMKYVNVIASKPDKNDPVDTDHDHAVKDGF